MVHLEKADVERIVVNVLNDLKINVRTVTETGRVIELQYKNHVISQEYFDVGNNDN